MNKKTEPLPQDITRLAQYRSVVAALDPAQTDFAKILVASAFVEEALKSAIKRELVEDAVPDVSRPTFYAAINLGHALGLYSNEVRNGLHLLREIRNDFAHPNEPVTLETPTIVARISDLWLKVFGSPKPASMPSEQTFIWVATLIMHSLELKDANNVRHVPRVRPRIVYRKPARDFRDRSDRVARMGSRFPFYLAPDTLPKGSITLRHVRGAEPRSFAEYLAGRIPRPVSTMIEEIKIDPTSNGQPMMFGLKIYVSDEDLRDKKVPRALSVIAGITNQLRSANEAALLPREDIPPGDGMIEIGFDVQTIGHLDPNEPRWMLISDGSPRLKI